VPLTGEKLGGNNTKEYQQTVLTNLQMLTNDVLGWGKDNIGRDIVIVTQEGGANTGKDLNSGTALLRGLINSDDKHAFIEAPANDKTQGNYSASFSKNADLNADGTSGTGGSTWIRFNPKDGDGGLNTTGDTKRPAHIGLGHELLHAAVNMSGLNDVNQTHTESDPNPNQGNPISKTEFVTRFLENFIRQEQGEPLRVLPPKRQ